MFKFLKEKLKSAISLFSRKAEEEAEEVEVKEEKKEAKPKEQKPKAKKAEKPEVKEEKPKSEKPKKDEKKKEASEERKKPEAVEPIEEVKEEKKPGFFKRIFGIREKPGEGAVEAAEGKKEKPAKDKKAEKRDVEEATGEAEAKEEKKEVEEPEKKGFFGKIFETITKKKISEEKFEQLFWDLEVVLMENNVAIDVIEKIKTDLKKKLVNVPIDRGGIDEAILESLRESIRGLFDVQTVDLLSEIKEKKEKPYVISFVGINGSGKTTTIAKIANMILKNRMSCVLAASDTFRAASQEQLQEHATKLGIKMIKHDYGADPAAVAFDAIKMAKAKNIDAVLIDTAGRLHSNINLMDELRKIDRVAKPDLTVFVGESITGNDCIEQAIKFNEAIDFDAIILTKADVDEKGGAAISVSYVTKKPIIYIGMGQKYEDLKAFDPKIIIDSLGL